MDVLKMIAELQEEHARLEEAILSLEKLARAGAPRRGRPPASSKVEAVTAVQPGRNGQNGSANVAGSSS